MRRSLEFLTLAAAEPIEPLDTPDWLHCAVASAEYSWGKVCLNNGEARWQAWGRCYS